MVEFETVYEARPDTRYPWFLGDSVTPVNTTGMAISMTDPRIAMSLPRARRFWGEGVYIWSVPPGVGEEYRDSLSPEIREQLEALGYID